MKTKFKILSFALAAVAALVGAAAVLFAQKPVVYAQQSNLSAKEIENDDSVLDGDYLDAYSVPTSLFSYTSNGGLYEGKGSLDYAFDRNFSTTWESSASNVSNNHSEGEIKNQIVVYFSQEVSIDRIVYCNDTWDERGFPQILSIYSKQNGQLVEVGHYEGNGSKKIHLFTFPQPVKFSELVFEWGKTSTNHRTTANAREIIFLQPEDDQIRSVLNMFSDYAQFTLANPSLSKTDIDNFRASLRDRVNYAEGIEPILNRAEQILAGVAKFDQTREYSTAPDAINKIDQYGNVAGYARNTLDFTWFGTNRQATGISLNAGQSVDIYVEADPGDPLPLVVCTQFWGHWSSWKSGEIQLKLGKNTITAGNYKTSSYKYTNIVAGGPLYIVNPYSTDGDKPQSQNVKLYFDGGTQFPVFHKGGDEEKYLLQLDAYNEQLEKDPDNVVNVTELVSDHFVMTVEASAAKRVYSDKTKRPSQGLANWDAYMEEVFEFDGVQFDPEAQYYNEMNKHLTVNIRLMQPYGAAYAYTEHVGIQHDWQDTAIYGAGFGWGYTHELGHMMDIGERTVSECSNNMVSKYNETAMEKIASRGDFDKTTAALAPDVHDQSYFNQNRLNFLVWWLIESYDIGYWAKLENLYRYTQVEGLNHTEKQVYLSSLATGIDLSYYFERWGYNLNDKEQCFKVSTATETFNTLMQQAVADKLVDNTKKPKLWYLDAKQYLENKDGHMSCYTKAIKPTIETIIHSGNSYNLILSSPQSSNPAHLGYEIIEGEGAAAKVVGFTHSNAFTDFTGYKNGYTPIYHVVAYDRALNASDYSDTAQIHTQSTVCTLGNTNYDSISSAIANAANGDTIYINQNTCEGGIVVDKNITILPANNLTQDVKIVRAGGGNLFTINAGATLTIKGSENAKIIIDGNNVAQEGALFGVQGVLNANNVVLQNNYSTKNGGAINVLVSGAKVNLTDCSILANKATNGGGIYNIGTTTITDCLVQGNSATKAGGGICNTSGGVITLASLQVLSNLAAQGGGIYVDGFTTIRGSRFEHNTAPQGNAIYYTTTVAVRTLNLQDNNVVSADNDIYLNAGTSNIFSSNTISSCIYKAATANIVMFNGMFAQNVDINLETSQQVGGSVVVLANNFSFTDEDAGKIQLQKGNAKVSQNGKQLLVEIETVNLTQVVNGQSTTTQQEKGKYTLMQECGLQNKYAASWNVNGQTYASGTQIDLSADTSITANLANKLAVTLKINGTNTTQYVIPQQYFNLPNTVSTRGAQSHLLGWTDEQGRFYAPFTSVQITSARQFTAVVSKPLTVTYQWNGAVVETREFGYQQFLSFPQIPGLPTGYRVAYWTRDKKQIDTTAKVTNDFTVEAVLERIPLSVTYYYLDDENKQVVLDTQDTVLYGDDYTFRMPENLPEGYTVGKLLVGDVEYSVGAKANDVTQALLVKVELAKKKFSVKYQLNGADIDSQVYEYGDTITLSLPQDLPENMQFEGYEVNGKSVELGSEITITQNTIINIVASQKNLNPPISTTIIIVVASVVGAALVLALLRFVVFKKRPAKTKKTIKK